MPNRPEETEKLYKLGERADLREDDHLSVPSEPHVPWYSRAWSRVKSAFGSSQQNSTEREKSAADSRLAVLGTRKGAAVVKRPQKSRSYNVVRNKGRGQENIISGYGSGEIIKTALKSKGKNSNTIGASGRYDIVSTEDDIRVDDYTDIEMGEMQKSSASLKISDFQRNITDHRNESRDVLSKREAQATIRRDTLSVEVESKVRGNTTLKNDKFEVKLQEIVDDVDTEINLNIQDTTEISVTEYQEGSVSEKTDFPKPYSATVMGDKLGCDHGQPFEVPKYSVEGEKSVGTVSGGLGDGSVTEKNYSTSGSSFFQSDNTDGHLAAGTIVTGQRSAGIRVGARLPQNLCFGSRGHVRIDSTWNQHVDGGSTTGSPYFVRGRYARIGRVNCAVPYIENANSPKGGYVRVGRVAGSNGSTMSIGNVHGEPSAGTSAGIQIMGGERNATESRKNSNIGAAGSVSGPPVAETISIVENNAYYGRRPTRWERDTPLFFKST